MLVGGLSSVFYRPISLAADLKFIHANLPTSPFSCCMVSYDFRDSYNDVIMPLLSDTL